MNKGSVLNKFAFIKFTFIIFTNQDHPNHYPNIQELNLHQNRLFCHIDYHSLQHIFEHILKINCKFWTIFLYLELFVHIFLVLLLKEPRLHHLKDPPDWDNARVAAKIPRKYLSNLIISLWTNNNKIYQTLGSMID